MAERSGVVGGQRRQEGAAARSYAAVVLQMPASLKGSHFVCSGATPRHRAVGQTGPVSATGRAIRATVFALVTVGLGVIAHALAMGGSPGPAELLPIVAVVTLLVGPLTRQERGPGALLTLVLITQTALHVAFGVQMAAGPSATTWWCGNGSSGTSGTAMAHTMALGGGAPGPMLRPAGLVAMLTGGSAWMLAGHVVAALAVAGWLRAGEQAVFGLARALATRSALGVSSAARRVRHALAAASCRPSVPSVPTSSPRARSVAAPLRLRAQRAGFAVCRRGPPLPA